MDSNEFLAGSISVLDGARKGGAAWERSVCVTNGNTMDSARPSSVQQIVSLHLSLSLADLLAFCAQVLLQLGRSAGRVKLPAREWAASRAARRGNAARKHPSITWLRRLWRRRRCRHPGGRGSGSGSGGDSLMNTSLVLLCKFVLCLRRSWRPARPSIVSPSRPTPSPRPFYRSYLPLPLSPPPSCPSVRPPARPQ